MSHESARQWLEYLKVIAVTLHGEWFTRGGASGFGIAPSPLIVAEAMATALSQPVPADLSDLLDESGDARHCFEIKIIGPIMYVVRDMEANTTSGRVLTEAGNLSPAQPDGYDYASPALRRLIDALTGFLVRVGEERFHPGKSRRPVDLWPAKHQSMFAPLTIKSIFEAMPGLIELSKHRTAIDVICRRAGTERSETEPANRKLFTKLIGEGSDNELALIEMLYHADDRKPYLSVLDNQLGLNGHRMVTAVWPYLTESERAHHASISLKTAVGIYTTSLSHARYGNIKNHNVMPLNWERSAAARFLQRDNPSFTFIVSRCREAFERAISLGLHIQATNQLLALSKQVPVEGVDKPSSMEELLPAMQKATASLPPKIWVAALRNSPAQALALLVLNPNLPELVNQSADKKAQRSLVDGLVA